MDIVEIVEANYHHLNIWKKIKMIHHCQMRYEAEYCIFQLGNTKREIRLPSGMGRIAYLTTQFLPLLEEMVATLPIEEQEILGVDLEKYKANKWLFPTHASIFLNKQLADFYKEVFKEHMKIELLNIKEIESDEDYIAFTVLVTIGEVELTCFLNGCDGVWEVEKIDEQDNKGVEQGLRDVLIPLLEKELKAKIEGMEKLLWVDQDILREEEALREYIYGCVKKTEEYRLKTLFL